MVCLNENISFNVKTLKKNLSLELKDIIDTYDNILDKKIVSSLKNKIEKKIKELFWNDHFIYLNMNPNLCVHKYKKGNNEGYLCSKKIKTNLEGQNKDYLCCLHSKKHIPKKRKEKKKNNVEKYNPVTPSVKYDKKILLENKKQTNISNILIPKENIKKSYNTTFFNFQNNIYYKYNIINKHGFYTELIKEVPLLDFCINKLKKFKNKKHKLFNLL